MQSILHAQRLTPCATWAPSTSHCPSQHAPQPRLSHQPRVHHGSHHGRPTARVVCAQSGGKISVLPAGQKQARVTIPGVLAIITPAAALDQATAAQLDAAIQAGLTGVVLRDGDDGDAAKLYDAALALKEALRGRVPLLVADRTDVAAAAEANGVVLSDKGVPTVVARRMLGGATALVACSTTTPARAVEAAADGANLVIIEASSDDAATTAATLDAAQQQRGAPVPVFLDATNHAALLTTLPQRASGLSGLVAPLDVVLGLPGGVRGALQVLQAPSSGADAVVEAPIASPPVERLRQVEHSREDVLEAERRLLSRVLAALKQSSPDMEEIGLLEDALSQLDELFLLVVVGEFNSGKSSVINSLLGAKYLAEGILPTTNEISVLKHAADGNERVVQDQDGFFVRYLDSDLLRDVNVVDTPGTNVILDRQQRLTEEYVPRADLVLFVLSADRPFTDSEVRFLKYIKQWGKKVVFIVNKVDILDGPSEVEEVRAFVADNAARLLGVEAAQVLPVSARQALRAKTATDGSRGGVFAALAPDSPLTRDEGWQASRFAELERFVYEFLLGGKGGGESMRLKLQTPLFIAEALLNASQQQLAVELVNAQQEAQALSMVDQQLSKFERDMARDAAAQRAEVQRVVAEAVAQAESLVDDALKISNVEVISTYLLGSKSESAALPAAQQLQAGAVAELERLRGVVQEHSGWIAVNCQAQVDYYRTFAEQRATEMGTTLEAVARGDDDVLFARPSRDSAEDLASAQRRRQWREAREAAPPEDTASAVVSQLQPSTALSQLDGELRDAVMGTAGTAAGAAMLGVVTTWILPTAAQDLVALAVAGAVAYTSVLNLPLRRADTKKKLQDAAAQFVAELEGRMVAELESSLAATRAGVVELTGPLEAYAEREVLRVTALQAKQQQLVEDLAGLKQTTARLE